MSEEILKALMELFALVVKQDKGMLKDERDYIYTFLSKQLTRESDRKSTRLNSSHSLPYRMPSSA